jgi:hypothetical protein
MLADCLTKDDPKAGDYLRHVVRHGVLHLTERLAIIEVLRRERGQAKASRQAFYDAKYPGRKGRKKIDEKELEEEGWSTSMGCSVLSRRGAEKFAIPPGSARGWRMTPGQDDLGFWTDFGIEEWVELPANKRKARLPKPVMKTLSVFAPSRRQLANWRDEFMVDEESAWSSSTKQDEPGGDAGGYNDDGNR